MPRRPTPWSKTLDEAGVWVRICERERGGSLYLELRHGARKVRRSLRHTDRAFAEQQARDTARELAAHRYAGTGRALTLGTAWRLYQAHRLPQLSPGRQRQARQHARFLLAHFGDDFALEDLSQSHVDAFAAARRGGVLASKKRAKDASGAVRDGTIRQNLNWLAALVRWARGHRVKGRALLVADPFVGLALPREKNVRRPVASAARYEATAKHADAVDPSGRFAYILALARYTGRRIKAIRHQRASDVYLSRDAVVRALAATGQDAALADHMPHGAIRWMPAHDKQGYDDVAPLGRQARAALDRYLAAHPRIGDAWLFPSAKDPARPISQLQATAFLLRAEKRAKLPRGDRSGFHSYRRLWAVERKALPDVDVARGGGWRDLRTMKQSHQQPDPATVLRVVDMDEAGNKSDTPAEQRQS